MILLHHPLFLPTTTYMDQYISLIPWLSLITQFSQPRRVQGPGDLPNGIERLQIGEDSPLGG